MNVQKYISAVLFKVPIYKTWYTNNYLVKSNLSGLMVIFLIFNKRDRTVWFSSKLKWEYDRAAKKDELVGPFSFCLQESVFLSLENKIHSRKSAFVIYMCGIKINTMCNNVWFSHPSNDYTLNVAVRGKHNISRNLRLCEKHRQIVCKN